GRPVTEDEAAGRAAPSPPPPPTAAKAAPPAEGPAPGALKQAVAEVLEESGVAPGEAARFARYKSFGSSLSPPEAAFAQAVEFLNTLGPARVISVSHAEDEHGSVVTVWYWAPPYEVQEGEGQQKPT